MAAVSALLRVSRGFCENPTISRVFTARARSLNCQRCSLIRQQLRYRSGKSEDLIVNEGRTKLVMKPLAFTVVATIGCFGGCAILQYEKVRASYAKWDPRWNSFRFPKAFGIREQLNRWWRGLPDGSKTAAGLIFVNTVVFLMWKIPTPRMQTVMWRWFISHPILASPVTLLTSAFSHMDFWHLAVNMYVLWSFAPTIQALLGREQFIAFYLSGGIFASFASQAFRILAKQPIRPSLGASGALFAVLSLVCIHIPETELALVFLPWFTFSAGKALMGVVALDVAGLVFRWSMFDHAAHLGGVIFGAWYLKYGHHYLWDKRGWLVQKWHKLRGSQRKSPP